MIIYRLGNHETLCYAARELACYLVKITGQADIQIIEKEVYQQEEKGIWLGLDEQLGSLFQVEDSQLDDGIVIEIKEAKGLIAGTNERSILIGVYRFLTELGCRFIRPCEDGERIVHKGYDEMTVYVKEVASYRHRGVVIEGANSYENVKDMIEWLPKLGYNSYFIQFMHAYSFFKQWYAHTENPLKKEMFFDDEMAIEFTEELTKEIKKRGLIYHAVGHGWTCEAIGMRGRGWGQEELILTEEQVSCLAEIKGKREFWHGVPLNTNLCYSTPKVQQNFVQSVVDYAKAHPNTEMIHVWVADDLNNHCECENCKQLTPTDWYIQILNRLDAALLEENLNHKIVFLLYFELLWTPKVEQIKNQDRFLMMFAPISRTFTKSYEEISEVSEDIPPFKVNQAQLPTKVEDYISFLKNWQKQFQGDSFDFDYHLGRAHYGDAGYYAISKIISQDIKKLEDLGLNGLLSCQQQRSFFPTSLPNYVMGKTLWNKALSFEEIANEYFESAFGDDGELCRVYLERVSNGFDMDYWHLERGGINEKFAQQVGQVHKIVDTFQEVILRNQKHENLVERCSWYYLKLHMNYVRLFADALSAKASGNELLATACWEKFKYYICENEDELQRVLDVFRILQVGRIFSRF